MRRTIFKHPSLDHLWVTRNGEVFLAAPVEMSHGYAIVSIRRNTRRERKSVHSIVLETFQGPRPPGSVSRHLNGIRTDNRAINLRWGSHSENGRDSVLHGSSKIGEQSPSSRLTVANVREIVERRAAGESVTALAREFGVKDSTLRDIFKKRTWASEDPAYKVWASMIQRCTNPNVKYWRHYGGRGIAVCDRWRRSFRAFLEDVGPRPGPKYTLDRINVNGNYEPSNVRWAMPTEQRANRRKQEN